MFNYWLTLLQIQFLKTCFGVIQSTQAWKQCFLWWSKSLFSKTLKHYVKILKTVFSLKTLKQCFKFQIQQENTKTLKNYWPHTFDTKTHQQTHIQTTTTRRPYSKNPWTNAWRRSQTCKHGSQIRCIRTTKAGKKLNVCRVESHDKNHLPNLEIHLA